MLYLLQNAGCELYAYATDIANGGTVKNTGKSSLYADLGATAADLRGRGILAVTFLTIVALFQAGCAGVNTFPTIARPGDTVSVMIGGSEHARTNTVDAILTDSNGVDWDLQALGKVRSVFNLRPDGRAHGLHYSPWLDTENAWLRGHEPVQTVMVFDLPGAALGPATLHVTPNVSDDASGVPPDFFMSMTLVDVPGTTGSSDSLLRQIFASAPQPAVLADLEPAPHAKISFGDGSTSAGSQVLYAASLVVDFDETVVNGDDINVYSPETTVRGSFSNPGSGPFGQGQHMVLSRHNGTQLLIDIVAPQGIEGRYLQLYVVHPRGLGASPAMNMMSSTAYDENGNTITFTPTFTYFP